MLRSVTYFVALLSLLAATSAMAGEHAAVAPYITDDVSSVAVFKLDAINLPRLLDEMNRLKLIPDDQMENARKESAAIQAKFEELPKLGARRAYFVIRSSDFFEGGPMLAVEGADAKQAAAVAEWLMAWAKRVEALGDVAAYLPKEFEVDGKLVVGAATQERIKAIQSRRSDSPRQDALDALASVGDADAAFVAFGDADSRRVIREMFPALPAPFMEIDGQLLADGLKSIAVTVELPPELRFSLAIEAMGEQPAATLSQAAEKGITILKGLAMAASMNPPDDMPFTGPQLVKAIDMLKPRLDGTRLTITLGDDEQELAMLQELAGEPIHQAREAAQRAQRMNQFKQIALAMHNYLSVKKSFPAAASYSADGKPLLSWRVHILPYLEQNELYEQFRLDEPWDSEHNLKLIEKMPDVYADPDTAVRKALKGAGYTTFVAPVGEGLLFGGKKGFEIGDVKDGTSQTILALEVVPDRAVIWTKPDDWQVDLSDPLAGVKRSDRKGFIGAYSDGHVTFHRNEIDLATLKALLTPAGGETVDSSKF